jgi:fibronectin type 3 domain-containing protein
VTLLDANGNPVAGKNVALSSSRGATDTITEPTLPTDAAGQATGMIRSNTSGTSTITATDSTDGIPLTQTTSVTFIAGTVSATVSAVAASPTTVVADGVASSTITVTLRDANGNPVAGKNVLLSSSRGATDTIDQAALPTDAAGQTTGLVRSTTAGSSTITATDSTDALVLTQTVVLTFVAGPVSATTSTVTASPLTVPADGVASSTITVTLLDANNNPVGGKAVTLASSRGGSDSIAQPSAPTDATGRATGTISSTSVGSSSITATDATDAITLVSSVTVTFEAPDPPTGLLATDHPGDEGVAIDLSWTPSTSSSAVSQRIYRSLAAGGPYALIASFADNTTTSYTDQDGGAGLTKGTIYFYVVRAVNGAGVESADSNVSSAAPLDNIAPNAPIGMTATDHLADEGGAIDLSWVPSTSVDVVEQRLYRSTTSGGPYSPIATFTNNTTATHTDSGLTNGTRYFYVIRAFDGTNESVNSNEAQATPIDNIAPAAPTGVAVADRPADQGDALIVSWTANTEPDLGGYAVYRSGTSGGPFTRVNGTLIPSGTTSYTDTGLTRGVTYYYVVRAVDQSGNESAASAEVSGAPLDNVPPAVPTGLTVTDHPYDAGSALDLAWTANGEADLGGYHVYRATAPGGPYTRITTAPVTGASYTDTGLTVNTTYYYQITAVDTSGNESAPSTPPVSGVPIPDVTPPAQVTNFVASDGEPARVTLTWTHPGDPDLAQVVVKRKGGAYPTSHLDGTTVYDNPAAVPGRNAAFADGGLRAGTYYYAVYSRDALGNWNDVTTAGANADTGTPVAVPFSRITIELASQADVTINGVVSGDQSGFAVASDGDINADTVGDVAIGAENAGTPVPCPVEFGTATDCPHGEVRVVFGSANLPGTFELADADFVITGANPGDRLGTAVANAGDLDGDGTADLVIGARQADRIYPPPTNTGNEGRVYVFFSRSSYTSPVTVNDADLIIGGPSLGGEAGSYLATDGDLNGDGLVDLVIGAPKANGGNGAVYVLFGRASWAACRTAPCALDLATDADVTIIGYRNAQFDQAAPGAGRVATGGDFNGDGLSDLAIGASGFSPLGRAAAGATFVVLGRPTFPLVIDLQTAADMKIYGATAGDQFGSAASIAGDVDGDGFADLVLGAQQGDPSGRTEAGRVYVLKGSGSYTGCQTTPCVIDLSATAADLVVNGIAPGDQLAKANALDTAGDVDGDGLDDIVIGALFGDPASRTNAGQAYAVFGRNPLPSTIELATQADVTMNGILPGDTAGYSVSSGMSIKGRGCSSGSDILIGADGSDPGGRLDAGQTYAVYGPFAQLPPILTVIGDVTVNEGQTAVVTITACDPNNDPIAFTLSPTPAFASFIDNGDGTATLTLTPGFSDAGLYTVTVTAADNGVPPLVDNETFTIRVLNVNRPPVLDPIGDQTANEGVVTDVIITASDPDGGPLVFTASNLPLFAAFTDNGNGTARLSLSPGFADAGTYPGLTVSVRDSDVPPASVSEIFTVTVSNVNRAPILTPIANPTVDEAAVLDVAISASDPDGDPITLSGTNLPPFATVTDYGNRTGNLRLTPDLTQSGTYPDVVITAQDTGSPAQSASLSITITVNDTGAPPPQPPTSVIAVDQPADEGGVIRVTWIANPDPAVAGYNVFRSLAASGPFVRVNGTLVVGTLFADGGLTNGTTYFYVVRTVDTFGQESGASAVTSAAPADNLAPVAPTLVAAADRLADLGGAITVTWTRSVSTDVTQQRVYRAAASGGPYTLAGSVAGNATTFTDTGLTDGVVSFYVVRAFDGVNEGGNSTETSATSRSNAIEYLHQEASETGGP